MKQFIYSVFLPIILYAYNLPLMIGINFFISNIRNVMEYFDYFLVGIAVILILIIICLIFIILDGVILYSRLEKSYGEGRVKYFVFSSLITMFATVFLVFGIFEFYNEYVIFNELYNIIIDSTALSVLIYVFATKIIIVLIALWMQIFKYRCDVCKITFYMQYSTTQRGKTKTQENYKRGSYNTTHDFKIDDEDHTMTVENVYYYADSVTHITDCKVHYKCKICNNIKIYDEQEYKTEKL